LAMSGLYFHQQFAGEENETRMRAHPRARYG
jgi:hypothetical protein